MLLAIFGKMTWGARFSGRPVLSPRWRTLAATLCSRDSVAADNRDAGCLGYINKHRPDGSTIPAPNVQVKRDLSCETCFLLRFEQLMRRQAQQELETMAAEGNILSRVYKLPVMNYAVEQAVGLYTRTKSRSAYLESACGLAEKTVSVTISSAAPLVNKLEKPISMVNSVACKGLDKLEENYPIIRKPTNEVWNMTNEMYEVRLKPYVTTVTTFGNDKVSAAQKTVGAVKGKVDAVKKASSDTISTAYNKVQTVTVDVGRQGGEMLVAQSNTLLSTGAGQVATHHLTALLTTADHWLDTVLPPPVTEGGEGERGVMVEGGEGEGGVRALTVKVYGRVRVAALTRLTAVLTTGRDSLTALKKQADLNVVMSQSQAAYNRLLPILPTPLHDLTVALTDKATTIYKTADYTPLYDETWRTVDRAQHAAISLLDLSLASPLLNWLVPTYEVKELPLDMEPDHISPPRWA